MNNAHPHMNAMKYDRILSELLRSIEGNQTELARRIGVTQPTVSRWISGKQKPDADQRATIMRLAADLGVIDGVDNGGLSTVPLIGYVGAGGEAQFSDGQGPFGEVAMPPVGENKNMVAVEVRGDSMVGVADDGYLIYYNDRRDPPTDDMLGKLCVVGLDDGRVLIKKLHRGRGPGLYDLYSVIGAPLIDQSVEWAARVTCIIPQ